MLRRQAALRGAFQHRDALRPRITEELGWSGRPGATATEGSELPLKGKAYLPFLHNVLAASPVYRPRPECSKGLDLNLI